MGFMKGACYFSPVLFLCFYLKTHLSIATDTISPGQSLTGNQTIESKRGVFELGFFTPGNSQNNYIGIWYKKISVQTVVWVANRDRPISDPSSAQFKLLEDGNLALFNRSNFPIWSTNLSSTVSVVTEAVLLDSGNLVLRAGSSSHAIIWQSFDHPTDTFLAGGKLFRKDSNGRQGLISWRNREDPAPGMYSQELDPHESYQVLLLWNRSMRYWTTGNWDGKGQFYSSIPEMRPQTIHNYSLVKNGKESYFTFTPYNNSLISRMFMDPSGKIQAMSWLEEQKQWHIYWTRPLYQCKVHAICGSFGFCNEGSSHFCACLQGFEPQSLKDWNLGDRSGGCIRKTALKCENNSSVEEKKDSFLQISNIILPINPLVLVLGNAKDCRLACLINCSCNAYAYTGGECSIWHGDLVNLEQLSGGDGNGRDLYIRLAASELGNYGGRKKKSTTVIIVSTVAIAVAAAMSGLILVLIRKRKRRVSVKLSKGDEVSLVAFRYKDLQSATNNFSEKLGGGSFGSVFKGTLPDSTVIAVKKLEGLQQGEKQFRAEVRTIGMIQHVNLVRLRGFCSEGTNRLLVYDYMPNGSLATHLFDQKDSEILEWNTRYRIALGTAKGLAYLHEKCRDCIIHCDIKPENILLDAEFCSKVADFGLAKLLGREFSKVLTTVRGTIGYLAPEWITGVAINSKADVYSYGMMLFEIISGRRNNRQFEDGKFDFFPTWAARKLIQGEGVLNVLDHRLKGNASVEELTKACSVACWCIQYNETHRPSMGQVVQILEGTMEVKLPPYPRFLQVLVEES